MTKAGHRTLDAGVADLRVSPSFVVWRDPEVYAAFPSLVATPAGPLIAFRVAPREPFGPGAPSTRQQHLHPRSSIALANLTPKHRAERIRLLPHDLFAADQDPNLLRLRSGAILLTTFCWRPVLSPDDAFDTPAAVPEPTSNVTSVFWGAQSCVSHDGGHGWTARGTMPELPGYPPAVPGGRPYLGGRIRGQAVEIAPRLILQASYENPTDGRNAFRSHLLRSSDGGECWSYAGEIAADPEGVVGFCEPTLLKLPNGELLALHRTFNADDRLAICRSDDDGASWTAPELLAIRGHPFQALTLPSGLTLLVYGVRHAPFSIRGCFLDPRGGLVGREFVIRSKAPSRDIGYPAAALLEDGRVLVVYYWQDGEGVRYIAGNVIAVDPT